MHDGSVIMMDRNAAVIHRIDTDATGFVTLAWSQAGGLVAHVQTQLVRLRQSGKAWTVGPFVQLNSEQSGWPKWNPAGDMLTLYQIGTVNARGELTSDSSVAYPSAWSPDGSEFLVFNSGSPTCRLLNGDVRVTSGQNGSSSYATAAFNPSGTIVYTGSDQSLLTARDARSLQVQWTAVILPEGKSMTFSGSGSILDGDRGTLDNQLVYYISDDAGNCKTLSPTEFELQGSDELMPISGRYFDRDSRFSCIPGDSWKRAPLDAFVVPGIARAAFSRAGAVSLTVFIQDTGGPVDPAWMVTESAKAQIEELAATVIEQDVRKVAGRDAMWMVVEGQGTGSAITGNDLWVAPVTAGTDTADFSAGCCRRDRNKKRPDPLLHARSDQRRRRHRHATT